MRSRHPSYATLGRFADGALKPRRRRRVADHLADCDRCRKDVAFIRHAGELARSLETPALPDDLLDRVLERRAAGDRVILPLESPGEPRTRPSALLPAVAAIVVIFAVGLFFTTGLLEADHPGLRIEPERPGPGEVLELEYEAGLAFADADHLLVRARYRTDAGHAWQQMGAVLERADDERFHAELQLPDSVVYAAFAVESTDGTRVDHNNGSLWQVAVHGSDGRPTLDALTQQITDNFARNQLAAHRLADRVTRLYPESPRGWWYRAALAGYSSAPDPVREGHAQRFRDLERALTEQPPADPVELAFMALFAATVDHWDGTVYWTEQAVRRGKPSYWLAQARTVVIQMVQRPAPEEALRELETIWREAPVPVPATASAGWSYALRARDWDAVMRWLPRLRQTRGSSSPSEVLERLTEAFGAEDVLDWALTRGEHELLRTTAARPVDRTPVEHERFTTQDRQAMLAVMSRLALATGQPALARGLAREGVGVAWQTPELATIGGILLEAGDTVAASAAYAKVAADPAGPRVPGAITALPDWPEALEAARRELVRHVLRGSIVQYLPRPLAPDSGPGIIAFLYTCDDRARALTEIEGVPVTVYAALDPVDSVQARLSECGLDVEVRPDYDGSVRQAFGTRAASALYVTDTSGRIRFAHSDPTHLPRQLMALGSSAVPVRTD